MDITHDYKNIFKIYGDFDYCLLVFPDGNDGYFIYTENQTHNINSYDPNDVVNQH